MDDEEPLKRPARRQRERRVPPPLDEASLRELALNYAARFATTRAKLGHYLARKVKERGWAGRAAANPAALAVRLAELGYVDDVAFAVMKGRAMAARGLGRRRVEQHLAAAGVAPDDRGEAPEAAETLATAIEFARRKRLGPFARERDATDPASRQKALAAMLRAGHALNIARQVLSARSPEDAEALDP